MAAPQSSTNHARYDSPMHFFVFPAVIANLGFAFYIAIHFRHEYPWLGHWSIIIALALLVLAFKSRINDLRLQDRLIRLEERLRLEALLPPDQRVHINDLTMNQFVALRFASDEELPALFHKTLAQNLEPKAIKKAINNWRPDNHRV